MSGIIKIQPTKSGVGRPVARFSKSEFTNTINELGNDVVFEKALQCACKSKSSNQRSNCKNCGGTGWVFINPLQTRAIIHGVDRENKYKEWSQESIGTVNISVNDDIPLSFMDRITVVRSRSIFTEVLHIKEADTDSALFAYLQYNLMEADYVGLFKGVESAYQRLTLNTDYNISNQNVFVLDNKFKSEFDSDSGLTITIRYTHKTQYHIMDIAREYMNSFAKVGGKETNQQMPNSAIGRRAHYIKDMQNRAADRIIDNSFDQEGGCLSKTKSPNC